MAKFPFSSFQEFSMPHTGNRADEQARDRFGKFRDEGNTKNLGDTTSRR